MNDLGSILVAICGFSVVCLGILVVGAFVFARTLGSKVPFLLSSFGAQMEEDDEEDEVDLPHRRLSNHPGINVKKDVRDFDFDAAVNRYRQKEDKPSDQRPSSTELSDPQIPWEGTGEPRFSRDFRDRRRGRMDSNEYDDEVMGGIWGDEDYDDDGLF